MEVVLSNLRNLGMTERLKTYRDLLTWAHSCPAPRAVVAGKLLSRWRSGMHALLDGGTISDLEGVSESVCCFLVECQLRSHSGGSVHHCAARVDIEAAALLVHAKLCQPSKEDLLQQHDRICQLVACGQCSVFDVARWATTTTMLLELASVPSIGRTTIRPVRRLAPLMSIVLAGFRRYITDKISQWDGPRFRAKLAAAVRRRELRYDEVSESRLFSRPALESRGSVRDKCLTDAREEFIHTVNLVALVSCPNLGPAADAIRTLVEMKILNDELEANTTTSFMKSVVALKSNRTDRGSDGIWASNCIIRECIDGFCLLSRRVVSMSDKMETVHVTSTTEPENSVFPFAFAASLWYATEGSMSADPLGLASYLGDSI